MKKVFLAITLLAVTAMFANCGGGGGTPSDLGFTTTEATTSGDITMSGTLAGSGSDLKLTLNSVIDPDTGSAIEDLTINNFAVSEAAVASLVVVSDEGLRNALKAGLLTKSSITPSAFAYASSSTVKADIVFIFDTTGSMEEEIEGVKNSITEFATSISESGVDARFGVVTYGDAYDTILSSGSSFTVGTGGSEPPSFDPVERPKLDLTDITALSTILDELSALGGVGSEENGLGATYFAQSTDNIAFRSDAARIFIVITDATSWYDTYYGDSIEGRWIPPSVATVLAALQGTVTVHVVEKNPPDGSGYVMSSLTGVAGTGGKYIELPADGDVDLVSLGISGTISYSSSLTWTPEITTGTVAYTITLTYGSKTGTLIITGTY